MEIVLEPFAPWHWVVTATVIIMALLVLSRGIKDRWRIFGRRPAFRAGAVMLTILAGILLLAAAWNPTKRRKPDETSIHLVVAIDGSGSVLKDGKSLDTITEELLAIMPREDDSTNLVVSLVTFADGVKGIEEGISLSEASSRLKVLKPGDFPSPDETDIEKGLRRAQSLIRKSGGAGMILLCSDGYQTQGDALKIAGTLGREGVKVHVAPVEGQRTPLRLSAAYLPKAVESGATVPARVVIKSEVSNQKTATLRFVLNNGLRESNNMQKELSSDPMPKNIAGMATLHSSIPVHFKGLGLQYFDAILDAKTEGFHQKRLFTMVTRPPRILSVGNDHHWTRAISKKSALVQKISPDELGMKSKFETVDAIVINAIEATDFKPGVLDSMVRAVEDMGVGLMLINGNHKPRKETDPTVLMSYTNSPVGLILPVSTKPRPFKAKPPPKQVFILIDASGSMRGSPLICAKRIAKHIVQNLLRPEDFLDLVVFATKDAELLSNEKMTSGGKAKAFQAINGIVDGGGTNPTSALSRIARKKIKNGGMIFLSDGGFGAGAVSVRPDCKTMVFEIDGFGGNTKMLEQLGDVFSVQSNFNPTGIKMPYFEPEKRTNYFAFGKFMPASMGAALGNRKLKDPGLEMEGTAVTYVREEAQLVFVRPKLTDPLLAYRTASNGETGVLTTAFPNEWVDDPKGKEAITDWVLRVIPFNERDRYLINVEDLRKDLRLDITLASPPEGKKPNVSSLSCKVRLQSTGDISGGTMNRPADNTGPDFSKMISVNRTDHAQEAYLFIEEHKGEDSIGRVQRIPILIPPILGKVSKVTGEDDSYGVNGVFLRKLAAAGNGIYFDPPGIIKLPAKRELINIGDPLWPLLFGAGLAFYLLA
ncbi:MAG: VWA domain-containing protein, partial [Opitutae bacterium]|nr:VWA domain-containing protein [Opitutae bacterium]